MRPTNPPDDPSIPRLVESERYEAALGLRPGASIRDIDRALIRLSARHRGEREVIAALNKAASALKSERRDPGRGSPSRGGTTRAARIRVQELFARLQRADSEDDYDTSIDSLRTMCSELPPEQVGQLGLRGAIANRLTARAVEKANEAGALIEEAAKRQLDDALRRRGT